MNGLQADNREPHGPRMARFSGVDETGRPEAHGSVPWMARTRALVELRRGHERRDSTWCGLITP